MLTKRPVSTGVFMLETCFLGWIGILYVSILNADAVVFVTDIGDGVEEAEGICCWYDTA